MVTVVKHWNRFLRETVDDPFLELLNVKLDGALSNLIFFYVAAYFRMLHYMTFKGLFQCKPFYDSMIL